jgi:hypothetical protein
MTYCLICSKRLPKGSAMTDLCPTCGADSAKAEFAMAYSLDLQKLRNGEASCTHVYQKLREVHA